MNLIPYKINEYLENVFYQIPKELFVNPYHKNQTQILNWIYKEIELLYTKFSDRASKKN